MKDGESKFDTIRLLSGLKTPDGVLEMKTGFSQLDLALENVPVRNIKTTVAVPAFCHGRGMVHLQLAKHSFDKILKHASTLLVVTYERGRWFGRAAVGPLVQEWNAPPTRKQKRAATRLLYAQLRLSDQLAETMAAQIEEQQLDEMASKLGIDLANLPAH